MRVSIVIPVHNAEATLAECLTACLKQTQPDCEVIVVDDGSTDATADIARTFPITLIQQDQCGPAAARNMGAKAANGEIVAFTDSDCVPHNNWIEKLVAGFGHGVGAVGGTYGIADPSSLLARLIHEEIAARHANYSTIVDFLGSYNLAIKRDAFETVGSFDETFRSASGEDNDISYRIADAGYKLWFTHAAIVDHYHPTRFWPYMRTQAKHGFWRVKLYRKHPARVGGDKYAGLTDMTAPIIVLTLPLVLLLFWRKPLEFGSTALLAWVVLAPAFALYRCQLAFRLAWKHRDIRMLLFVPLVLIRDFARGIGLLKGVWTFTILRRTTA